MGRFFQTKRLFRPGQIYNQVISFNDDIQGTGSITLAGILAAMKVKNEKMSDQVYLVNGAGAGGVGIAEQIRTELMAQGMDEASATARISPWIQRCCHQ